MKKKKVKKKTNFAQSLGTANFFCAKYVQSCMLIKKDCTLCKVLIIIITFVKIRTANDKDFNLREYKSPYQLGCSLRGTLFFI